MSEYAIVWVILLVIAGLGLLEGFAAGLLIAAALFVVDYSRTDVVKHALSGASYQSRVERAPAERTLVGSWLCALSIPVLPKASTRWS